MTFGEAADALVESMSPSWRNEKHRAQWRMNPPRPIAGQSGLCRSRISPRTIRFLSWGPIWLTKSETASRLRGRIERVLDFAKAKEDSLRRDTVSPAGSSRCRFVCAARS